MPDDPRYYADDQPWRVNIPSPSAIDLRAFKGGGRGAIANSLPNGAIPDDVFPPNCGPRQWPVMGDVVLRPTLAQTADMIALPRSNVGPRIFLFIQNLDAAATLYIAFDQPASASIGAASLTFAPGASYNFMDFVPQNEIHVLSSQANGFLQIMYCESQFPNGLNCP